MEKKYTYNPLRFLGLDTKQKFLLKKGEFLRHKNPEEFFELLAYEKWLYEQFFYQRLEFSIELLQNSLVNVRNPENVTYKDDPEYEYTFEASDYDYTYDYDNFFGPNDFPIQFWSRFFKID